MRRILGNVLWYVWYGTMGIVCLSAVIIVAALLGFMCWLTLTIWSHVFAFFM